jgi:small-conductance mechanosensitive channel
MEEKGLFYAKLFKLGPVDVALVNLVIIGVIFLMALIIRKILHARLKSTLKRAKLEFEGKSFTGTKLMNQGVYALAVIIAINSFRINNPNVTFSDFLTYELIKTKNFEFSIYHVFLIVALFFGAKVALNFFKLFLERKAAENQQLDQGTQFIYLQVAKYIIYIFAVLFSVQSLGINLMVLLTGSAALLVGGGLGLQDFFRDMISGFILLFEGSIKVGDIIEIRETSGMPLVAKVLKINIRTTKIETRDGNIYIIPNAKLTQEYVENWNFGSSLTRFSIPIKVAYGSDVELVRQLLRQAVFSHPKVKKNQEVNVRLLNFGDDGLEMDVLFFADQSWRIEMYKSEIRFEIDRLFREYGINVPYPQRVVHYRHLDNPK